MSLSKYTDAEENLKKSLKCLEEKLTAEVSEKFVVVYSNLGQLYSTLSELKAKGYKREEAKKYFELAISYLNENSNNRLKINVKNKFGNFMINDAKVFDEILETCGKDPSLKGGIEEARAYIGKARIS